MSTKFPSSSHPGSGKLAYLSSVLPSATFIYREILELQRRGYALSLYSIHYPSNELLCRDGEGLVGQTYYLLPIPAGRLVGGHLRMLLRNPVTYFSSLVRMTCTGGMSFKNRVRSLLHWGEGVVMADQMVRDGVTHIHGHYASQPTSVVRVVYLLTGIPYSFSAHASDIWHDKLLLREKVHEARFVSCCNCCGQDELRREAQAPDREKVHLIYHGIDIRRFKPPEDGARNPRLVVSVGRFDPVKGFPVLIEACRLLREQGVSYECRMVGDGDEFAKVKDLVARYKLESHVHLLGGLPQDKIIRHYQEASVFVLPCIEGDDGRHDGLPNVVLEAMACGVPVISTPIGAVREAVEDNVNGLLCKPNSPEDLAAAIRRVLNENELRTRLGRTARECVETRFDSQASIEPLIRLFQSHCGLRQPEVDCRERMPA